jgi:hypothetical protein
MSRTLRFSSEEDLQQVLARTRGIAASVGGQLNTTRQRLPAPAAALGPLAVAAIAAAAPEPAARKAPRSARSPAPMKVSEDDLQISCFQWIELMRPAHPILEWIIHVPNGGKRPRGAAGKLKAMGVKPGVLDVLLPLPFNGWSGLAIEMKVGSNKTTEQQDDWLQVFEASGYYTAVCYTLEDFMSHVRRFLAAACPHSARDAAARQAAYLVARRAQSAG